MTLAFDDLPPSFDGYRLLHVTDPHFDSIEGTAERIAGWSPTARSTCSS